MVMVCLDTSQRFQNCSIKLWIYADSFFITADILKEIFDHIPQFSLSKIKLVLDQNQNYIIRTSKKISSLQLCLHSYR